MLSLRKPRVDGKEETKEFKVPHTLVIVTFILVDRKSTRLNSSHL